MKTRSDGLRRGWRASARLLAALTMTLSVSACATLTRGATASTEPDSAICARWPDAGRPPIQIWPGDSDAEIDQKVDFLIVWEVECGIERRPPDER